MPCLCSKKDSFDDDICGTFLLSTGVTLTVYSIDSSSPGMPPLPISGSVSVRSISGGPVDVTVLNSAGATIDSFTVPLGNTITRTYGDIGFVNLLNNTAPVSGEYGLSLHY